MNVFQANARLPNSPRSTEPGSRELAYGETMCGGHGAGKTWKGESAVHSGMTNTTIGDAEITEKRFPVIVREFSIRANSGGKGKNKGGDGAHREFEFIVPTRVGSPTS